MKRILIGSERLVARLIERVPMPAERTSPNQSAGRRSSRRPILALGRPTRAGEVSMLRCEMNGRAYADISDGIWDDGEFISWDWINGQLHRQERQTAFPNADEELIELFDELVESAARYKEVTGRYLPIFGELGEVFAELRYGLKRNKAYAPMRPALTAGSAMTMSRSRPSRRKSANTRSSSSAAATSTR